MTREWPGPRNTASCFTTEDISLEAANDLLTKEGLRGIMRFDDDKRLDNIPTLGTGKVDNKSLRTQLQASDQPPPAAAG